jgi:D-alanyl-D-alanine carboxypeptidase
VLYVPETEVFLYTKNADQRMPMASTTKIMTALVTIENADLGDTVNVPMEAVGIEGSSAYLRGGEVLTVEELLYALMLQSANDVAATLAYHIGGSTQGFADMMNAKAESLGLRDTHFTNPHGLDDKEHYTTARELAVITAEALKNDDLKEIVSTDKITFANDERRRTYINHNKLLHMYDGCIGVKTGFTKKSGRCLVGAAERCNLTFISVTLDAPNDWSDHKKLLDLGYDTLEKTEICSEGEYTYEIPVIGGKSDYLKVTNKTSLSFIREKSDQEVTANIKLSRYAIAPINKGDILGEIIFTENGSEIGRVSLVAENSIEKQKQKGFFERFFR